MCGIVGKIALKERRITQKEIEQMGAAIKHRGPDDQGLYVSPDQKVGLGHQRLSIIDLSPLGHQPMRYLDRYEIVFNGEIYNFQEKREELITKGYAFQSHSDTEVILALYAEYGKDCVKHLRGMFAFALYDEQEHIVFCARDRVGKKPFKYYQDKEVFMFASELKAILTQPEYEQQPDYEAIHHYLTLQYVPAPRTGFEGIKKLEPAHTLTLDLKTNTTTKECYWKLDYSQKWNLSEEEWKQRILDTFDEAVKLRMIADVPLGAFLSGGIDSSAAVAMMAKHSQTPVKTFSIGFKEDTYNELPFAKQVAEKFGTDHTEFIVEPDAINLLPMLVRQYEEPFADSSALPTYLVSKLTREHVTVALNGDGGDENFAGYSRYSAFQVSLYASLFWLPLTLLGLPLCRLLYRIYKTNLLERLCRFIESLSTDYRERYMMFTAYFTTKQKERLYTPFFTNKHFPPTETLMTQPFKESHAKNKTEQAVYADFTTYLPDDLLVKVDIASMAVSLEGRSPFLDHELLELTAKIPFSLKLKGLNNKKYILKEALRGIVPDAVMFRPKMGFGIPVDVWFRQDLKQYTRDILLSPHAKLHRLLKREGIQELLDEHQNTTVNHAPRIWALLTLELWLREYFSHI